jgi:phospholipase/carboxylesterase
MAAVPETIPLGQDGHSAGRFGFRPRGGAGSVEPRDGRIGIGSDRDGVLYVPDTAERSAPVLLFLHGAGGSARRELRAVLGAADRYRVVVAAPDSRGLTWDIISVGRFGPDVEFADRVLDVVADTCDVDFGRLAIGGISDGASYALSLGVSNGDLFRSIVAFSPGFVVSPAVHGRPDIFISHGTHDRVLPIDRCGRSLAAGLRGDGYTVVFHEFDGGHGVPPEVADLGFRWWLGDREGAAGATGSGGSS